MLVYEWTQKKGKLFISHRYNQTPLLYSYPAATTKHPCCIPTLGDSMGAGRIRLTQLQKYYFFLN